MNINRNATHKAFELQNDHTSVKSIFAENRLKTGNGSKVRISGIQGKEEVPPKMKLEDDIKIKLRELDKLSRTEASTDKELSSFFSFADQMYAFMERCISVGLNRIQELNGESADRKENSSLEFFESQGISVQDPELRKSLSEDTYENRKKWVENYIGQDLRDMLNFAGRFMKGVYITADNALGGKLSDILNKFAPQIAEGEEDGRNFSPSQLVFFTSESLGIDGNVPAGMEEQETLLRKVLHAIQERRGILNEVHDKFKKETVQDDSGDISGTEPFAINTEELDNGKYDYDAVIKMFDRLNMSRQLALVYGTIKFQDNRFESLV